MGWACEPDAEPLVAPMSIAPDPRYVPLRVRAVVDETADAKSFVFEIPPAQAQAWPKGW